jgi:hypothetical protein
MQFQANQPVARAKSESRDSESRKKMQGIKPCHD